MQFASIRKNAFLNVLGMVLPLLVFLVLTPIMVEMLGTEGFGVIVIIQSITGYMNFMNIGFGPAITKQIAECIDRDNDRAMRVMWAGLALFLFAGCLGGTLIYSLAPWLAMDLLEIPEVLRDDTVAAIRIGAVIFLLQMLAEYYQGSAFGLNRFDIPNISRILRVALSAIFILYVLENNGGVPEVMAATLSGLFIGLLFNGVWMQRVHPFRLVHKQFLKTLAELFHFSKHVFLVRLSGMFIDKLPHLFLGSITSVGSVALYSVPQRIVGSGATIMSRILQVFYPSFSRMDEVTKREKVPSILFSVLSIQLFLTTPFILMFILEGSTLLSLWINESFAEDSASIIPLVTIALFLRSLAHLPYFCALSFNYLGILSKYALLQSFIMIVAGYPLILSYGLEGAAWCLLIASLTTIPYTFQIVKHLFNINLFAALQYPLLVHTCLTAALLLFYNFVYLHSYWYTPLGVVFFCMLYWVLAIVMGGLSNKDRNRLFKLLTLGQ